MIRHLETTNIGPTEHLEMQFAPRLNLMTGDNGLGKSFLLDIIWWCMTKFWPSELNRKLAGGLMAYPTASETDAFITYELDSATKPVKFTSQFDRNVQSWRKPKGRPANPGIVFYAMADGSVSVWDSARNYWKNKSHEDPDKKVRGYVFSANDIWNGLKRKTGTILCNGLLQDWVLWQIRQNESWIKLKAVLEVLSPSNEEKLTPGPSTRVDLEDAREIPTLIMPYQQAVPIIHLSSGMRRIISLAYLLIWCWEEHVLYAKRTNSPLATSITFLFDESESHLHPKWQRNLVPSLLNVIKHLSSEVTVQLILSTHSPLIMSSVETIFDTTKDAWFDLDLKNGHVELAQKEFQKQGDYSHWLTSDAFDLPKSYNIEAENIIRELSNMARQTSPSSEMIKRLTSHAEAILPEFDPYLKRWMDLVERKGWLK